MTHLEDIKKLPLEQRLELVEAIWDSIAQEANASSFELTPEQEAQLANRVEAYEKGENALSYTWAEAKAMLKLK